MKKTLGATIVILALFIGFKAYENNESVELNHMALANIEALASDVDAFFEWYPKRVTTVKSTESYFTADSAYLVTKTVIAISCPYLSLKEEFCISKDETIEIYSKRGS